MTKDHDKPKMSLQSPPKVHTSQGTQLVKVSRKRGRRRKSIRIEAGAYVLDWYVAQAKFRKSFLKAALNFHKGNIVHTAKALGISRRTLQLQMRKAGLEIALDGSE